MEFREFHRIDFLTLLSSVWTCENKQQLNWCRARQPQRFWGSNATLRKSKQHEYWCFQLFAKEEGGWHIAKSIRNMIPTLVAVLKPPKMFKNELPYHSDEFSMIFGVSLWSSFIYPSFLRNNNPQLIIFGLYEMVMMKCSWIVCLHPLNSRKLSLMWLKD